MDLNISLFFTSILLISIHISGFISRVDSLRHIYDEGDVLYILRSKFLLSSMYYAAYSVLTLFSALSFPRSLCLFSPPAYLYVLWCVLFLFIYFCCIPPLHCIPELLQRCLRFRHTLGTYLSPSSQGRRTQTTKLHFFPWVSCSSVLTVQSYPTGIT